MTAPVVPQRVWKEPPPLARRRPKTLGRGPLARPNASRGGTGRSRVPHPTLEDARKRQNPANGFLEGACGATKSDEIRIQLDPRRPVSELQSLMEALCERLGGSGGPQVPLPPDVNPVDPPTSTSGLPRTVYSPADLVAVGLPPEIAAGLYEAMRNTGILFDVISGLRTRERQDQLIREGRTKTPAACSLHVPDPTDPWWPHAGAVDLYPVGIQPWVTNPATALALGRLIKDGRGNAVLSAILATPLRAGDLSIPSPWRWGGHFSTPSPNHFDLGNYPTYFRPDCRR